MKFAFLFIACFGMLTAEEYYSREAVLHVRKDGTALLEVEGHLYEIEYIDHSDQCKCKEVTSS